MSPELAESIFGTPHAMGLWVLATLVLLLAAAAWTDLQQRRIPNALVFSGAFLALALHTALPAGSGFISPLPGGLGLLEAVKGLGFGLLALLPLYLSRGMGAGDVKLMAMVGAFVGPALIWPVLLVSVFTGGVMAVAVALRRGILGRSLANAGRLLAAPFVRVATAGRRAVAAPTATTGLRMPYGLAIASGSIGYLLFHAQAAGLLS